MDLNTSIALLIHSAIACISLAGVGGTLYATAGALLRDQVISVRRTGPFLTGLYGLAAASLAALFVIAAMLWCFHTGLVLLVNAVAGTSFLTTSLNSMFNMCFYFTPFKLTNYMQAQTAVSAAIICALAAAPALVLCLHNGRVNSRTSDKQLRKHALHTTHITLSAVVVATAATAFVAQAMNTHLPW